MKEVLRPLGSLVRTQVTPSTSDSRSGAQEPQTIRRAVRNLLWDKLTGKIDHEVVAYMREHGFDLREYTETR
jgi:hypothetical protein